MANIEASNFSGENNWALLLDPDGFIAEGTGDNFFIIKDGVIITPEGRNILRGISRDYVMNTLCPQLKLPMIEKNIEPYDVYTADEAFMTGTPFCMLPVTSLNSISIGRGKVGPIFSRIVNQWSQNTGIDIIKQIKDWNETYLDLDTKAPTPYRFKKK
jgi:branched-chain amino acid aminotransferase